SIPTASELASAVRRSRAPSAPASSGTRRSSSGTVATGTPFPPCGARSATRTPGRRGRRPGRSSGSSAKRWRTRPGARNAPEWPSFEADAKRLAEGVRQVGRSRRNSARARIEDVMAILKVARLGHPILRQVAEPIPPSEIRSPEVQRFIDDMVETMREYDGAGLAANQVHTLRQVAVIEVLANPRYADAPPVPLTVLINPVVTPLGEETEDEI